MDSSYYDQDDYRAILKDCLKSRKTTFGREYTFEKMAQACRVQRTYLSTVLGGNGHINSDQLYLACDFLEIDEDGYRYLKYLHEFSKSSCQQRRSRLEGEIDRMRSKQLETSTHLTKLDNDRNDALDAFYLDFNAQLIHMFFSIKEFRDDLAMLQRKLRLDSDKFNKALRTLERASLISTEGGSIKLIRDSIHLPPDSPFYDTYRTQMRLRALEKLQTSNQDHQYSFSVLFSADDKTRRKIQHGFLNLITEVQKDVEASSDQGVYQMNFDLFQW